MKRKKLQWHPAFYAGLQIEFAEEMGKLTFENEHHLGTKPRQIDVLVLKKKTDALIQKNIGRIFRKHNLIEYKSPGDYMSIDDFYRLYAYVYLYKTDSPQVDAIKVKDITMTLVSYHYPREMLRKLQEERNFTIEKVGAGIYYLHGDVIPIQLLVSSQLSEEENLWLCGLSDKIKSRELADRLLKEYETHSDNHLYSSVMEIIVKANQEEFQEENIMCEALEKIIEEKLEQREKRGIETGMKCGMARGIEAGEEQYNRLMLRLVSENKYEEIARIVKEPEYRKELYAFYGI